MLYCTCNRKGNFKVGMRTEKSRLRRSLMSLQELMRQIRHHRISDQVSEINAVLRGHHAYYGVAGNIRSLQKVHRVVERYWLRMLRSRRWAAGRLTWDAFNEIKQRTPLLQPKLRLPYATCGNRGRETASGDPVGGAQSLSTAIMHRMSRNRVRRQKADMRCARALNRSSRQTKASFATEAPAVRSAPFSAESPIFTHGGRPP